MLLFVFICLLLFHTSAGVQIYAIRHGQAEHNLDPRNGWRIPDPSLTALGRSQAQSIGTKLRAKFDNGEVKIFCSPLRRTIQTAMEAFPGHTLHLRESLQETADVPSDRGSSIQKLRHEFGSIIDTSHLSLDWETKPKEGRKEKFLNVELPEIETELRSLSVVGVLVVHHGVMREWLGADFKNGEARLYEVHQHTMEVTEINRVLP
eukprot:TRINITY_DN67992_c2_g1_i1.p1 TRINITY_DN67992_c2_g1~~TRINITY_DN67992_c2_g1_i1.p1  ORF type:complete len:206 (+),score=18.35 TRINITY_DN67992_c2_g1_i1:40-657(+)